MATTFKIPTLSSWKICLSSRSFQLARWLIQNRRQRKWLSEIGCAVGTPRERLRTSRPSAIGVLRGRFPVVNNPVLSPIGRFEKAVVTRSENSGGIISLKYRLWILFPRFRIHQVGVGVGDQHAQLVIRLAGVACRINQEQFAPVLQHHWTF